MKGSHTARDNKWKWGNPDTGILLKWYATVKAISVGGSEMEADSESPRKLNISFPLVFTLNLSQI